MAKIQPIIKKAYLKIRIVHNRASFVNIHPLPLALR